MRAGQLDRLIRIDHYATDAVDDFGTPTPAWTLIAENVPAQIVQASTTEYLRGGANEETAIIFRIRWLAGITLSDRVTYEGGYFNIKETKEIGRRNGLDLRCVRLTGGNNA